MKLTMRANKHLEFEQDVDQILQDVKGMLLEKNRAYGDAALNPVRIFSKASSVEQILVRMDDKLSRIMRGQGDNEDSVRDFLGYVVLLRIAEKRQAEKVSREM